MRDDGLNDEFAGMGSDEVLEDALNTVLDDASSEEMEELVGLKVLGLELWEESLGDEEEEEPPTPESRIFFDCDLLLEEGLALELYAAAAYPDPDADPVKGMEAITEAMERLADENMQLLDFDRADEEGGLALAFGMDEKTELVLTASAWLVSEWEEDESAEEDEA